ncbi:DUF2913 family protein [Salmonella enterica]|nr:DUF2913 family protein [Salmonella enterica]EDN6746549.1 DUF2913 family protein [Salmonella enterica]ELI0025932.1 DUF2913 family protein [Salmonella enterica]ELI0151729.1 DUF2913 family protein [Salmonella enterica]
MRSTEKKAHLVWCAMIALLTARQNGLVTSESQENLFITRWFALAKKQRRFSRDVAIDIDWILSQGQIYGTHSRLFNKLEYIWRICTGDLAEQNDLFRLTCALEMARQCGWVCQILGDSEWGRSCLATLPVSINSIFLLKDNLEIAFNDDGFQTATVPVKICGKTIQLNQLLQKHDWEIISKDNNWQFMAKNFSEVSQQVFSRELRQ